MRIEEIFATHCDCPAGVAQLIETIARPMNRVKALCQVPAVCRSIRPRLGWLSCDHYCAASFAGIGIRGELYQMNETVMYVGFIALFAVYFATIFRIIAKVSQLLGKVPLMEDTVNPISV